MEVVLDPLCGGSIATCKWKGMDILRPHADGRSAIDFASFPLVPFCNRIAHGRISVGRSMHALPRGPRNLEPDHALHGVGWISAWTIGDASERRAVLTLRHDGTQWPWQFSAVQEFELFENGFCQILTVTNDHPQAMPTGLGFHPYFPRAGAEIEMEAKGIWRTGKDRLPERYVACDEQTDWFAGDGFDDCVLHGGKSIAIRWPTHRVVMTVSANLPFAHVYTPQGETFFCVEPVSHIPDAVNSTLHPKITGLTNLPTGETMRIECLFQVEAIN